MALKALKIIAIFLAIVAIALLYILLFFKPANTNTGLEVDLPHADDLITSPVAIEGSVTGGGWFFEGSFPVKILDGDGAVIGQGSAKALSDWMSTATVPFATSIVFTASHYATGTILFMNDNPSGSLENQKSLSVPIRF